MQIEHENEENWKPRKPPCWEPQENNPSSNESVDVEEGVSVDESQQSSTGMSLENQENEQDLPLGSIELVNTLNGENDSVNDRPKSPSLQNNRPAPIKVEVENMDDIEKKMDANINSGPVQRTPLPKAPEGSLDFGPISPSHSADSKDSLLNGDSNRKKAIRFSPTNEVRHFVPSPDEFDENPKGSQQLVTCGTTARLFLVVYALPFMHGASSNITTLYLLVELTLRYKINSLIVGGYLALAYLFRLTFALLSRLVPKTCVLLASIVAYFGFGLIYTSQDGTLLNNLGWEEEEHSFRLFLVGSILANTNEISSAMQIFVRDQLTFNVKETGQKLKRHYLIAKFARVTSFGGGGVIYHYYGVHGLAVFGGLMVSLQIMCITIFFILDTYREVIDQHDGLWGEMKPPKRFTLDCSIRAAIGRRRLLGSSMSKLNRTLTKYYPSAMPSKIVRVVLPICVYGRTIASMIVWNAIALVMRSDFHQNFLVIGGVFAGIMICDFLITIVTLSDQYNISIKTQLPSPNDVYVLSVGITLSLALVAVPNFSIFVVGLVIYVCMNSAMRTLLFELQGTSDSIWDGLKFHFIRCSSTAAALFSIPVLNSFHKRLPLVLAIWFSLLTTLIMVYVINVKVREEDETYELERKNASALTTGRSGRISRRPEKNLVYGEQIMLSRFIKGKDV